MLSNRRSRGALITSAALPATLASTVAPTAASQAAHAVARRQRWTLGVVCAATALLLFNVTAPIVALPSVTADLGLSFTSQQWVLSSYALVLASLLLAGGALGDRFGRRRLFLAGLGGFAAGSGVAALAGSGAVLIVATAEPTANTPRPARNMRLRPNRSPSAPPARSRLASTSA